MRWITDNLKRAAWLIGAALAVTVLTAIGADVVQLGLDVIGPHATTKNARAIVFTGSGVSTNTSEGGTNTVTISGGTAVGLFTGSGTTGTVTSAAGDAGKYLKADGTWGTVAASSVFRYFLPASEFSLTGSAGEPVGYIQTSYDYLDYSATVGNTGQVWVAMHSFNVSNAITNEVAWISTNATGAVVWRLAFEPYQTDADFALAPTTYHSVTQTIAGASTTNFASIVFTPAAGETNLSNVARLFITRDPVDGGDTSANGARLVWVRGWQ